MAQQMIPLYGYNGEKLMAEINRLQLLRQKEAVPERPRPPTPSRENFGCTWAPKSETKMFASLPVSPLNFECYAHKKIGGMCCDRGFRKNEYDGTTGRVLTANPADLRSSLGSGARSDAGSR